MKDNFLFDKIIYFIMGIYEDKLNSFLKENSSDAEILIFDKSCHSVEEAAKTANRIQVIL